MTYTTATATATATAPEYSGSSSAVWDDPHSLLVFPAAPRPALPLFGMGRWFSCCVPKKSLIHSHSQQLPKLDQDETERTDLEEEDDEDDELTMIMDSFLDAVDVPCPVQAPAPNNNNNNSNKSAMINNIAQEILQTLLGIFMINYFIDVFRQKEPPKQIRAEETAPHSTAPTSCLLQ